MTKRIEHKLITTIDRAHVLTSRGVCLGPIYPYIEDVDQILFMIKEHGLNVFEVNGEKLVELTEENYDKDTSDEEPTIVIVESVSLNHSKKQLEVGDNLLLVPTISPNDASETGVTWDTNNSNVALVTDGNVTTNDTGTAKITVKTVDGNHTATCDITVIRSLIGISITPSTHKIDVDNTTVLTPIFNPINASNKQVTWESSDPQIAKVENGTVTGVSRGTTTITVKSVDGNHTATCDITVNKPVQGVSLNKSNHSMKIGESITLIPNVTPSDASNTSVTWESTSPEIAKVEDGVVTALTKGSVEVTVKTIDGNHTSDCTITVSKPVQTISLDKSNHSMNVNETIKLVSAIVPLDASNTSVTWESTSPEIAKVEDGMVTALNKGKSTITVKTVDGNHTATCEVIVNLPVTKVVLSHETHSMAINETVQLECMFTPVDPSNKQVTWESSSPEFAKVENGLVTALAEGVTTITVKSVDGNHTATCEVTINTVQL